MDGETRKRRKLSAMKKIKFWNEIVEEYYGEGKLTQESYECLTAFLKVPEIAGILEESRIEESECMEVRQDLIEAVLKQKQFFHDILKLPDHVINILYKLYGQDQEVYVSYYMERFVLYTILLYICENLGYELGEQLENQVKYKRYSKYEGLFLGVHEPSPVVDLSIGNIKRGKFYKREPKDKNEKLQYGYREDGNLISCVYDSISIHNKNIYFIVYFSDYIFYLEYCDHYGKEWKDRWLTGIYILKLKNRNPEYLERMSCIRGDAKHKKLTDLDQEFYIFDKEKLAQWWLIQWNFPDENKCSGVIIKDLYTAIYDENGCLSGYTVVPYIGKRPRDGRLEGINVKHQGNETFELSEKEKLDTEKDALRWKYPPTYFS